MQDKNIKVYHLTSEIPVYVKTSNNNINFNRVLKTIRNSIPPKLYSNTLQEIMVGNFQGLKNKAVDSGYDSGVIYVEEDILRRGEDDVVKNIIHEIGHAIEEDNGNALYSNQDVQTEFLDKRMRLYDALEEQGLEPTLDQFMQFDYDAGFDEYLMGAVGYDTIKKLSDEYMIDPYAFTDLHEYIIMNFEKYAMGDVGSVRKKSSTLYPYLSNMLGG